MLRCGAPLAYRGSYLAPYWALYRRTVITRLAGCPIDIGRFQYTRAYFVVLGFTNTWGLTVSEKEETIAVVGIGNSLLTDDGVGIHALERFADSDPDDDVICIDGGTVGLALLDRISNLEGLVVLDAMKLGHRPGTVTVLEGEAMDAHLRNQHGSVHEVGLSDLMDALRLRGDLPGQRAIIGIEPEDMGWGTWPTPVVAASLPETVHEAQKLVRRWRTAKPMDAVA